MRKIIKGAVDKLGYEFLEAENGHKALGLLSVFHNDIGLILLDWNIPDMTGLKILETIKANTLFKHIPVIMVTSEDDRDKVIAAINQGAEHYVIKPFTQEDLVKKILKCVSTPKR